MTANSATLNKQLLSQLECPICFETCVPPIYMCSNGHSVCSKCQPQLLECSECRCPGKPTVRSIQLEKIAELVEQPCENQSLGCAFVCNITAMAEHLPQCQFSRFECRVCKDWKGTAKDLKDHVSKLHNAHLVNLPSSGTPQTVDAGFHCNHNSDMLICLDNSLFWLNFNHSLKGRLFSATVRLVSHNLEESPEFIFTLEFPASRTKLKLSYQGEVVNLTKYVSKDLTNFAIPAGFLETYDYRLIFTLAISKIDSPPVRRLAYSWFVTTFFVMTALLMDQFLPELFFDVMPIFWGKLFYGSLWGMMVLFMIIVRWHQSAR